MTIENLEITIGGDYADITDIMTVEVNEAYKQACSRFRMEVEDPGSYTLNDYITIDMGYDGDSGETFQGFIDTITSTRRPGVYEITGRDVIKRAIDHWIVTTDLENPWSRRNISAENLVRDLLNEAGITGYSGDTSNFTFGVSNPVEFQIISSWDAIEQLSMIIAWRCYAKNGTVYFQNLQPEPSGAPVTNLRVGNIGNIETIDYDISTENLRNRVVVFGRDGIYAEDSAVSPYLPDGFYKTAIVSSELIDTQSMADDSASYNLALYNRLTESCRVDILGNYVLRARDTINISEPFTTISGDWFIYSCTHRADDGGFTTSLHLTR